MDKQVAQRKPRGKGPVYRRLWFWALAAVCLAVLLAAVFFPRVTAGTLDLPKHSAALLNAAKGLDEISIAADFQPGSSRLEVTQSLRLQNRTGQALTDVVLRTYANAFLSEDYSPAAIEDTYDACYPGGFSEGYLTMDSLLVGGKTASYTFDDGAKTVQRIQLPEVWQPGEWIDIALGYAVRIPDCSYRFGYASGIWTLGNTFILPSVWEDGAWRTEEYFPLGDPFYSECANYSVTVNVPKGYQCAGSAYGERTEADGRWVYAFDAPAVREFALSISNKYAVAQEMAGDVLVTGYGLSANAAAKALKYGKRALECFSELYGVYPYRHYAVATVDFPYSGMEYPGLILVKKELYEAADEQSLELVIAHETAHQWWYAVVGSDQYYNPWQDEAMAEYSLLDYVQKYYGDQTREDLAFSRFETAMRVSVPQGVTPGSPIDYFGDMSEYSLVVYRRGAAMLEALHTALDEKFQAFQRAYFQQYAFRLASRADFEQTLKEVTGQDWSALMLDYLDTYIIN